jgi:hypothetical protein
MSRPKIQNFEDMIDLSLTTAEALAENKITLGKAREIHLQIHDVNTAIKQGYKAQVDKYKMPNIKFLKRKTAIQNEVNQVTVKSNRGTRKKV